MKVTMIPYAKEIVQQFQEHDNSTNTAATPAAEHLFKVNEDTTPLTQRQATVFHNFVAKSLFLTKRATPDIVTTIELVITTVESVRDSKSERTSLLNDTIVHVKL